MGAKPNKKGVMQMWDWIEQNTGSIVIKMQGSGEIDFIHQTAKGFLQESEWKLSSIHTWSWIPSSSSHR